MQTTTYISKPYPFSFDPELVERIKQTHEELSKYEVEAERKINALKGDLRIWVSKLNIAYREQVLYCLKDSQDILRTPLEVSECVANSIGFKATREIKNNVATTLGVLFTDELVGRTTINGVTYYGHLEYFKKDRVTLKQEYINFKINKESNG